jgi:hypothetical protein
MSPAAIPGPWSRTEISSPSGDHDMRTLIGEPAGLYWAAFSSRCASADAVNRGSSQTGRSASETGSKRCCRKACST